MALDLSKFLRNKLIPQPSTITKDQLQTAVQSDIQADILKKFGVVSSDLRKLIENETLVNYERSNLYLTLDRSQSHALMSAATALFADVATTRSSLQNATVWVTAKSKEYKYQIEKMLDIINIEEVIYDWAWSCIRGNTKISLIDGTTPTIKEIAENKDQYIGKAIWSINPVTKQLEVDQIINAFKTKHAEIIRIILDNGQSIDCTLDHKFMLRDGSYKEAQHLVPGESLMPLYFKGKNRKQKFYNPKDNKWYYKYELILTKEFLEENYIKKKLSTVEISKIANCHLSTVIKYLRYFNIPVRSISESKKDKPYSSNFTRNLYQILTKEFLIENYINKKLSTDEIGIIVNCSGNAIINRLKKLNISIREKNETKIDILLSEEICLKKSKAMLGKYIGKDSPNWKGGISSLAELIRILPKCKDWGKQIFQRDNYICQDCNISGGKLEAHHISPFSVILQDFLNIYSQFDIIKDKLVLVELANSYAPFWNLNNGVTLCEKCHSKKGLHTKAYQIRDKVLLNHKVLRIEKLNITEDVYDLSIKKNHNFPTEAGVFIHNCATFGDLFVQIHGEPGVGIVSVNDDQHPINVSRVDYNGRLIGFYETPQGYNVADERQLLTPWDFCHFRLLGAKRRRPMYADAQYSEYRTINIMSPDIRRISAKYGTSVLADALPIFKRLTLAEDSLMLARLTRGTIKYLYKIGVSGSNTEQVASLIDNYVDTLKRARSLDVSSTNPSYGDRANMLSAMEDIILPVWGDVNNNLSVEKLGGEVDIKWIVDIEEWRNQLATALKVPLPILAGYADKAPGGGLGENSLERLDIRFARQARRVQRSVINGLTRMAQIHLAYQGIDPDLNQFTIEMAETSSAEEEELKNALDKGTDICTKYADLLEKFFPNEVEKREVFDYLNKKFLKLNDFDLSKMLIKPNPQAFEGEQPRETPIPGVETPAVEEGEVEGESSEPNPFRENADYKSALPKIASGTLNEQTDWHNKWKGMKVKIQPIDENKKK